jgi:Glycosyltransferase family 10 (fucosyltransferase) C-term
MRFRQFPKIWKTGHPANFKGRAPGQGHFDDEYLSFLSAYKVAVCLENCVEPHYFTEKFVNAARAGCIPVYHAHPTVRDEFLRNAKWVDPSDFGFSPRSTIEYALAQDQSEFQCANDKWLKSSVLDETDDRNVLPMLHRIIRSKIENNSRTKRLQGNAAHPSKCG